MGERREELKLTQVQQNILVNGGISENYRKVPDLMLEHSKLPNTFSHYFKGRGLVLKVVAGAVQTFLIRKSVKRYL